MTDLNILSNAIRDNPLDLLSRLALADALEEIGNLAAARMHRKVAELLSGPRLFPAPKGNKIIAQIKKHLNFRGRKVTVVLTSQVERHDTIPSGGTASNFHQLCLCDWNWRFLPRQVYLSSVVPVSDVGNRNIVIETGYFCGKPTPMTIYVHPEDYLDFFLEDGR